MAEHCARLWVAAAPCRITLLGRDADRLAAIAADLAVRSPASTIRTLLADFLPAAGIETAVDQVFAAGPIDLVLIAHGMLPDQPECQQSLAAAEAALQVNAVSPALFAEAFARRLAAAGRGTLAVIGSVAGDRGRKSNYVYGAAKGLLDRYAQGLQHRFAGTPVQVVLIKPGPTDTPMTAGLKRQGARLAPVGTVAAAIVRGIERGDPVVYVPARWRLIMWVIRHLPRPLFNRLDI